ncbi:hypothetical protein SASPL_157195 [Salvia splendens]|uniref:Glutathione peroxidase n=1 Tax=Salvia splendens TaxID=180675 RepID=A0A8X8VVB3_SALSN|nr:hypothetical protein SASPL_157195 [Salvia splendens]
MGASSSVLEKSIHEFTVKDSKCNDINLSSYKGKVLFVVNVASNGEKSVNFLFALFQVVSRYWHSRATSSCIKNPEQAKMHNNLLAPDSKLSIPFSRRFDRKVLIIYRCEMVFCLVELKLFVDNVTTIPSFVIFNCLMLYSDCQVKVNGPNAAPVYKFLKASKGGWFGSQIKWNFTKFLVDKDGIVIKRYATSTSPLAIEGDDVKKALGES